MSETVHVTFDLPLNPRYVFSPEALEQLAAQIVDKPVRVGQDGAPRATLADARPGGYAAGDLLGKVTHARVDRERVVCDAELLADAPMVKALGENSADYVFGVDMQGKAQRREAERVIVDTVSRVVGVATFSSRLAPPGGRPNIRIKRGE